MLGFGWFLPVSLLPFSLLPLLLWLAAGTGACLCFFDDSTMLPHPPSRRVFSPNRLAVARVSFFKFFFFVPAWLALRDTEQVNRAHHTLHVSVFVICSGSVFVKRRWPLFFVMWYLAAFGSNSQRFSGELLVPLFRCCC